MTQTVNPRRWLSSSRLRRFADRVLASDPGLQRLRGASQVTLSTVTAALISYLLVVMFAGGSSLSPLFGAVAALLASNAVQDARVRGRKLTTLLLFFPALISVAVAGLLSSNLLAQWLALSLIVFGAFYLRRFGPRYGAVGFLAAILFFVSSIVSSFLGFGIGQLPWIAAGIAVGLVCVYAIRFYLLPDNPRSALRRGLSAFDLQLVVNLETVSQTLADRHGDESRDRRLQREAGRLRERVSAAEGRLLAEGADISRERSDRLRLYLFDAEMSANTLWEIVWRDATSECAFPDKVRDPLLRALRELCATLRQSSGSRENVETSEAPRALQDLEEAREAAAADASDAGWSFQVRRADAAIRQLSGGLREEQGPVSTQSEGSGEEPEDEAGDDREEERDPRRGGMGERLRPTTVQGIQATLAVGLALAAGEVFSSSRPYWVVIIAFLVFAGSGTLGDTLARGFQRTAGTLTGAVAGFFLAGAVSGSLYLEGVLIVACIFLAFYMFSISQTIMMFWITVLLAVAFDILGVLGHGGILALRFYDTVLGSVIGLAVSALVFPTRPSEEFRGVTTDFLDSLEGYVRDRVRRLAGGEESRHPVERASEVESKLDAVVQNAATARRQAMVFGRPRTDLNHWMTGLLALNYYARHLAGPVGRRQRLDRGSPQSKLIQEIGDRISSNIVSLRRAISEGEECRIQDIEEPMQRLESSLTQPAEEEEDQRGREAGEYASGVTAPPLTVSPVPGQAGPANALHYLRRINRALGELAAAPAIGSGRKRRDS